MRVRPIQVEPAQLSRLELCQLLSARLSTGVSFHLRLSTVPQEVPAASVAAEASPVAGLADVAEPAADAPFVVWAAPAVSAAPVAADAPFAVWVAPAVSAAPVAADAPFAVWVAPAVSAVVAGVPFAVWAAPAVSAVVAGVPFVVLVAPAASIVAATSAFAAAANAEFDSAGAGHVETVPAVAPPPVVAAEIELSAVSQLHAAAAAVAADLAAARVAPPIVPAPARLRLPAIHFPDSLAAGAIP